MVGADLANVVNEAALTAARRGHDAVTMGDLHDALEKLVLGTERRILLSPRGAPPHRLPRGRPRDHRDAHARARTRSARSRSSRAGSRSASRSPRPRPTASATTAPTCSGKIKVALGGRVAEELVFDDITTGAQNDIKQATELARNMVGVWGMSDVIGPVTVITEEGQLPTPRRQRHLAVRRSSSSTRRSVT